MVFKSLLFAVSTLTVIMLTVVLSTPTMAQRQQTNAPDTEAAEYIFYLLDRSASMSDLPDNTSRSTLIHASKVARLARRKVYFSVITFAGREIRVFGDPNKKLHDEIEMPTTAHEQLLKRVLAEWQEPAGATPMDLALEYVIAIRQQLPKNSKVTVVYCGDGMPYSGWVRGDDFPEVAGFVRNRIESISQQNYPAEIISEMMESYLAGLQNPESEEGKRVLDIQARAEMVRCKQHVAELVSAGVRWVTFAFVDIPELRDIHNGANANPQDFVLVEPAGSAVAHLHNLGLTSFEGVVKLVPTQVEPDNDLFETAFEITLPAVGDRAAFTWLIDEPYADLATHSKLSFEIDGNRIEIDTDDNSDPNIVVGRDESGRVASVTVSLDVPENERLVIHYDSPNVSKHVPAMTILAHLRLADDLTIDFRPVSYPSGRRPVEISPNLKKPYLAGLYLGDDRSPYPLAGLQAVVRGHDDSEMTVDFVEDASTPGQFISDIALQFPAGEKDIDLYVALPDGTEFSLVLPGFLVCKSRNEYLTLEYINDPQREYIFFPELGDEVTQFEHSIKIRPGKDLQYSVPLSLSIQAMLDSKGNTLPAETVKISRPTFNTQPGGTQITLSARIPETLAGVVNGKVTGQLQIIRTDLNLPIDVRNFTFPNSTDDPTRIEFALNQPQFSMGVPRKVLGIGYDEINAKGTIEIHVDMWTPMKRQVLIQAGTTSAIPRDCSLFVEDVVKDSNGKPYSFIKLSPSGSSISRRINPRSTATWIMDLDIPEHPEKNLLTTGLIITGEGVAPRRIPVELHFRSKEAMWAPFVQKYAIWTGIFLACVSVFTGACARRLHRKYGRGARHELSRQKFAPLLSLVGKYVQVRGRQGKTMFKKHVADRRPTPAPRQLSVDRIRPGTEFFEGDRTGKETGLAVEVTQKRIVRSEPMLIVIVRKSGDIARRIQTLRSRWKKIALFTLVAFVLATFAYRGTVVTATQFIIDFLRYCFSGN